MRCVVTGGSGFIGQNIVRALAKEGQDVVVFDVAKPDYKLPDTAEFIEGDVRYYANLYDLCSDGIDEIYDCAGILGTHELIHDSNRAVDINIGGAVNVLKVAVDTGVKRLFHPTKPNEWLNTYSITKHAAERFCQMYAEVYGLQVVVMKWFNAYGPAQKLYPIRKVVPMFAVQALRDLPIEIWGDGFQTVDMIHVEDIAKFAIGATRRADLVGKICDVGSGTPLTVNQLADFVIELTGSKSEIVHLPMRAGEPTRSTICADTTALGQYFPLEFKDFKGGMIETIEYYAKLPDKEVDKALLHFETRNDANTKKMKKHV